MAGTVENSEVMSVLERAGLNAVLSNLSANEFSAVSVALDDAGVVLLVVYGTDDLPCGFKRLRRASALKVAEDLRILAAELPDA